ncbi:MAG: hypothetical protein LBL67_06145 [Coriobacteriales bacterium]|jgi:hypothetical protein|nr:hypothetical protein [Coriobacteriales bacterium]
MAGESKSYQDPLAGRLARAEAARPESVPVHDNYRGAYRLVDPVAETLLVGDELPQPEARRAFVSAVYYSAETKGMSAEIASFDWSDQVDSAVAVFVENLRFRIMKGEHPKLALSQQEFDRVLSSGGKWYLVKQKKRRDLPKGTIYFRKRQAGADAIASSARRHTLLWTVIACLFWLVVLALLVLAVWWFFLRGLF